ncbi:hypothetical protein NIES4101_78240 [Calothrix sp. NIES-4101]|nr:hypothetical protein NIES4101_78240 [Calothrix sp. NIES-4101]
MNDIINDVTRALGRIDQRFYELPDIAFSGGILIDRDNIKQLEKRFMMEFSRKYTALMRDNGCLYNGVEYDFEIPKMFMWGKEEDFAIRETWERLNEKRDIDMIEYFTMLPDFLVHAGQNKQDDQRLIIEAKVNPNTSKNEVFKDIFHTFIYANKYNFQNNVILLINIELAKWQKWLLEYYKSYYLGNKNRWESIYIVNKKSYSAEIIVETIASFLLNKD